MVSDAKKSQDILDTAGDALLALDNSHVFFTNNSREFPQYESSEIVLGDLLGKGGFSSVHEIDQVALIEKAPEEAIDDKDESKKPFLGTVPSVHKEHFDHYDVVTAREFMSKNYLRHGSARYAIKQLKSDLGVVDRARGAVDLAIEIKFLTTIWHPNIIKMRGYSKTPRISIETFLILDRLYGTLDEKIEMWAQMAAATKGCCGASEKSPRMLDLLEERLLLAYDLSSAISYLHGLRLLYRDIKPENIGFDIRGDVKLFDFGLCKSMEPSEKNPDGYGYNLTAKTGSIPYMAPEIALGKPYDKEADVYSFSILLWEIIGLEWAFNGFDAREYFVQVCARNLRLSLPRKWPAMVRVIIQEGWDPKPDQRPSMNRIGTMLRGELKDITSDNDILNRDEHMMNKSKRSARGILDNSRGQRTNGSSPRNACALGSRSVRQMFVCGDACGEDCGDEC